MIPKGPDRRHSPAQGAILITIAMVCMVLMDSCGKYLLDYYPIHQILIFRAAFALLPILYLVHRAGGFRALRFNSPVAHIGRAICGIGTMFTFFEALKHMTLVDATAIGMTAPILIALLSIPLLGERVGIHRWTAIAVGLIGVVVMLRPTPSGLAEPAGLLALAAAFLYALIQIITRKYAESETTEALGVSYNLILILTGLILCAIFGYAPVEWGIAPQTIGVGLFGGLMMIFMIGAYRAAEASFISSLDYTAIVWAGLFGWIFWGETPDPITAIGAVIVSGAGLYILRRETMRKKIA